MQRFAAQLRHRELTQELYDIGDEIASYLENLAEAVTDCDAELVTDCLAEFEVIAGEARADSRGLIGELIGLRQALTSGVRSGTISAFAPHAGPQEPAPSVTAEQLAAWFPLAAQPVSVTELSATLEARTQAVTDYLARLVTYVLEATAAAAADPVALSYPHLIAGLHTRVRLAIEAWQTEVDRAHPAYTRAKRGAHPPAFLAERARVDAVVAKIAARRRRSAGSGGAAG